MSRSMLIIRVIASELVIFSLSAGVVWGFCGFRGDWPSTMYVAPNDGAWIETIGVLIGVPIESR